MSACTVCENIAESHDICIKFHALIGNQTKRDREEADPFDPVGALTTLNNISLALLRPFLMRLSPIKLQEMVMTAKLQPERFQRFLNNWTRLTNERVEFPFRDNYVRKWVDELIDDTDLTWSKDSAFTTFEMFKSMFRVWISDEIRSFVSRYSGPIGAFVEQTPGNVDILEDVYRKRATDRYTHMASLDFLLEYKASDSVLLAWFEWRGGAFATLETLGTIAKNAYLYPKTMNFLVHNPATALALFRLGPGVWNDNMIDRFDNHSPISERMILTVIAQTGDETFLELAGKSVVRFTHSRNVARAFLERLVQLNGADRVEKDALIDLSVVADMDTPWIQEISNIPAFVRHIPITMQMARLLGSRFKVTRSTRPVRYHASTPVEIELIKAVPEEELIKLYDLEPLNLNMVVSVIMAERFSERFYKLDNKKLGTSTAVAKALVKAMNNSQVVLALQLGFSPEVLAGAACAKDRLDVLRILVAREGSKKLNMPINKCFRKKGISERALACCLEHSASYTLTKEQWSDITKRLVNYEDMSQAQRLAHVRQIVSVFGRTLYIPKRLYGEGEDWIELQIEIVDLTEDKIKDTLIMSLYQIQISGFERRLEMVKRILEAHML